MNIVVKSGKISSRNLRNTCINYSIQGCDFYGLTGDFETDSSGMTFTSTIF